MLKKYKEFKNCINDRNSWAKFCLHHLEKAIESRNKKSEEFWSKSYVDAINERTQIFGSNIKYAVIYKLTHRSAR